MFAPDLLSGDAPDASIDVSRQLQLVDRGGLSALAAPDDGAIQGWTDRARRLALDLSGTTPTLLPDLLRAVSKQAGLLASDPVNALDNNPFIMREWLIVSQAVHAAAATMEKRFEALFLGL